MQPAPQLSVLTKTERFLCQLNIFTFVYRVTPISHLSKVFSRTQSQNGCAHLQSETGRATTWYGNSITITHNCYYVELERRLRCQPTRMHQHSMLHYFRNQLVPITQQGAQLDHHQRRKKSPEHENWVSIDLCMRRIGSCDCDWLVARVCFSD